MACLWKILAWFIPLALSQLQCYYPDGTLALDDTPCNATSTSPSGTISPCCSSNAMCLDNGYCLVNGLMYRGSCTSSSFETPCPQHCKNDSYNPSGAFPLTACNYIGKVFQCNIPYPGEPACYSSQTFTLSGGSAVILRPNQVNSSSFGLEVTSSNVLQLGNSSSSAPSSSTTISSSSAAVPSSTASSTATCSAVGSDQSEGYSAGALAGGIVGVGVPLALTLAAAVVIILRQRKQIERMRHTKEVSDAHRSGGEMRNNPR